MQKSRPSTSPPTSSSSFSLSLAAISLRMALSLLVLSNLLMFQMGAFYQLSSTTTFSEARGIAEGTKYFKDDGSDITLINGEHSVARHEQSLLRGGGNSSPITHTSSLSAAMQVRPHPFSIPKGEAVALPSVRIESGEEESLSKKRGIYGGVGDKPHLGGFTEIDLHGISPSVWKYMITTLGIKSLLDVGCGRGISTSWFALHGVDTLCVEGSHDAVVQSVLPNPTEQVVEHDFSRGPWWPPRTVDAVWCVEFTEHVGRNYIANYVTAFWKSALILVSHSNWGGWHHVEVHDDDWWKVKFESLGFLYSKELTDAVRRIGVQEKGRQETAPNGGEYNAQHVWTTMQVFINPVVASLPQHAHLFAEPGCYLKKEKGVRIKEDCGSGKKSEHLTPLPPEFKPLELTEEMDKAWEELIRKHVAVKVQEKEERR